MSVRIGGFWVWGKPLLTATQRAAGLGVLSPRRGVLSALRKYLIWALFFGKGDLVTCKEMSKPLYPPILFKQFGPSSITLITRSLTPIPACIPPPLRPGECLCAQSRSWPTQRNASLHCKLELFLGIFKLQMHTVIKAFPELGCWTPSHQHHINPPHQKKRAHVNYKNRGARV